MPANAQARRAQVAPTPLLAALDADEWGEALDAGGMTYRALLEMHEQLRRVEPATQMARLSTMANLDERMLLAYALSLEEGAADRLAYLIGTLGERGAHAVRQGVGEEVALPEATADEWRQLHSTMAALPAQVHHCPRCFRVFVWSV